MDNKIYDIYGMTLKTSIELVGASITSICRESSCSLLIDDEIKSFHDDEDFPCENPYVFVNGDEIIVSWQKNLTYKISANKRVVRVYKEDYVPTIDFTFSLNYILSVLCLYDGMLPIHGACLQDKQGKVHVFIGGSSVGKSTLTARLLYKGWRFIAEEMTALKVENDKIFAYGGGKYIRLSDESIELMDSCVDGFVLRKKGIGKEAVWDSKWLVSEAQPRVTNIIYLCKGNELGIQYVKYQEALPLMTNNIYAPAILGRFSRVMLMRSVSKVCAGLNCLKYSFEDYPSADYLDSYFEKQGRLD